MIPPTLAHEALVNLERARLAARLEKTRLERDQANILRIRSRAAHQGGTYSLRVWTGSVLMRTGALIAGRDWLESARSWPASAPR